MSRRSCAALSMILLGALSSPASAAFDVLFQDGFQFGFHVQSPEITLASGEEATYCYYFRAPNATALGVNRWRSHLVAGMGHVILFTTASEGQPPGTLTTSCGFPSDGGWQYAAHDLDEQIVFPSDDGSGTPLGSEITAGKFAVLQMYAVNPTGQSFTTSAYLSADALDPANMYTKSAAYMTYNTNISIPPMSSGTAQGTCAAPAASKFWLLTTRTHRHATQSKISNAGSDVVVSTDWEHPATASFATPNFVTFPGGLTYQCDYLNTGNFTLHSGDSEATDEVCMGIGYFFPADTGPKFCFNSTGPL